MSSHTHSCHFKFGGTRSSRWYVEVLYSQETCLFTNPLQLIIILFLGFMAFPPMMFFVALYLQNLFGYSALMTAVHMLPMVVSGIVVNVSRSFNG